MSDFTSELADIGFGEYQDDDRGGDGLTRIQWRQGDVKAQTPGYFFLAKENVPEGFAPAGDAWKPTVEYFEMTRTRADGWKAEALPMCIICARAQPYLRGDTKTWLEKWPKGAAPNTVGQHADVLLVAGGLEDLGPICWSTNSSTVAFAIITGADPKRTPKGGILHRLREEILKPMGKAMKPPKDLAKQYWLVWLTIASQRDAKGNVVFTPTAGKDVTLPVPLIPDVVDLDWLRGAYSGRSMAVYGEEQRFTYDTWRNTRMTNDTPVAAAGHRNIPQPMDVDEL